MRAESAQTRGESHQPSRLTELLECERELAELTAAARKEADRRVEDARAEVALAEAELEASLEAESERVRSEIRAAAQARVHEILGRARERADRYASLSAPEVDRLAEVAFRRLLGGEPKK